MENTMSNYGGPNSVFEKELKRRFADISVKIENVSNKIKQLVLSSINNAKSTTAYWNNVVRELDTLYVQLSGVFNNWIEKTIPSVYKSSLSILKNRIDGLKYLSVNAQKGLMQLLNSNASTQIVKSLYMSALDSYSSALLKGKDNIKDLFRMTQQLLVQEADLNLDVALGFDLGDLRKSSRIIHGQLYNALLDSVENGGLVQAGNFKYDPKYYAEMVARVKFHEAHTHATLMQANNYGTDLVQVSSHNTTTKICMPYEGKVYSINGKDKRFPPLMNTPPYHPNCLHLIYPTFESGMIAQGTLDAFSSFSLGKISRPPVPASFVPLGKRLVA
jgi:hypothetical protein